MNFVIISYYWPPAGGAGVQRWLNLAGQLARAGHKVRVLAPSNGDWPDHDQSLLAQIHPAIRVSRCYAPKLSGVYKAATGQDIPFADHRPEKGASFTKRALALARANLIVPDLRVLWYPFALAKAIGMLRKEPCDWLITTGPPHSTHLLGLTLQKLFKLKWATDFRDPWSNIYYNQVQNRSALTVKVDSFLEQTVLNKTDALLCASWSWTNNFDQAKTLTLVNGCRQSDFNQAVYKRGTKFRVRYFGRVINAKLLTQLINTVAGVVPADQLEIEVYSKNAFNLPAAAKVMPFVGHQQALGLMRDCELLLFVVSDYPGSKGWIPIKLPEYIAAGTPVVAIGPTNGDSARLLQQHQAGSIFNYNNVASASPAIASLYQSWLNATPVRHNSSAPKVDWQQRAAQLLDFINKKG